MGRFFSDTEIRRWSRVNPGDAISHNRRWFEKSARPLSIYGGGQVGMMARDALADIPGVNERIVAFFDSNSRLHGSSVEGTPITAPEDPTIRAANPLVIVAANNREWLLDMEKRCHALGYETVRYGVTTAFGKPRLDPGEMERHGDALAALDIWADDESRQTYRTLIRLHATWDFSEIHEVYTPVQYFQPFLPEGCQRSFVDGGAFTGDTLDEFLEHFGDDFDNYYAFEPDSSNFEALVRHINEDGRTQKKQRIHCYRKGLYNREASLRFRAVADMGSAIDDTGELAIETVALDDVLGDAPVTFIKMDVEGSEPEALEGMAKIIARQKPVMAVCVYHESAHLWRLPLWLKKANPGYRLYLRHHSMHEWETVCYAAPE